MRSTTVVADNNAQPSCPQHHLSNRRLALNFCSLLYSSCAQAFHASTSETLLRPPLRGKLAPPFMLSVLWWTSRSAVIIRQHDAYTQCRSGLLGHLLLASAS